MTDQHHRMVPMPVPAAASRSAISVAPKSFSPAEMASRNRLCEHGNELSFRLAGAAVTARLALPDMLPKSGTWLEFGIDGHTAYAGLSWGMLRRLVGIVLEGTDPFDAALLAEQALTPWLDAFEQQTGLSIRFRCFTEPEPAADDILLSFQAQMTTSDAPVQLNLPVTIPMRLAGKLSDSLAPWKMRRSVAMPVFLRVTAEIESLPLTFAELRGLGRGDALVLPDLPLGARLILEDQLSALVRPADDGALPMTWELIDGFRPLRSEFPQKTGDKLSMTESENHALHDTASRQAPDMPGGLDALQVRVSFRLGERLMSLAELRRAGPGTIMTLDRPDGAQVDLVVNGQVIGTGEVVTVAGQRAVEITNLFNAE